MIKKFNLYKESLLNKIKGPTEGEALDNLQTRYENGELDMSDYVEILIKNDMVEPLDYLLYGYNYESETYEYCFYQALDYESINIIKHFLNLGISNKIVEEVLETPFNNSKIKNKEIIDVLTNYLNTHKEEKKVEEVKPKINKFEYFINKIKTK